MNPYYITVFGIGFGVGTGLSAGLLLVLIGQDRWFGVGLLAGIAAMCFAGIALVVFETKRNIVERERGSEAVNEAEGQE